MKTYNDGLEWAAKWIEDMAMTFRAAKEPATVSADEGAGGESDPRNNGCLCQLCGLRYKVDFMVPDDLWSEIQQALPRRINLLCGTCIVFHLERLGRFDYFNLVKLDARTAPTVSPDPIWDALNEKRLELITAKQTRALSLDESREYLSLQCVAGLVRELFNGEEFVVASNAPARSPDTEAQAREAAQIAVINAEKQLGKKFDGLTRHALADTITVALQSSSNYAAGVQACVEKVKAQRKEYITKRDSISRNSHSWEEFNARWVAAGEIISALESLAVTPDGEDANE